MGVISVKYVEVGGAKSMKWDREMGKWQARINRARLVWGWGGGSRLFLNT